MSLEDLIKKNLQSYRRITEPIDKVLFHQKRFKVQDHILIVGSPRSGTSWFMEVLGNIPEYTFLFEPSNPWLYHEAARLGFHSRPYVAPTAEWRDGKEFFDKIFSGDFVGFYSLYGSSIKEIMRLFLCKKLLVKCIRINRLLPWVLRNFDIGKHFFVIRHPCAVIVSQLKAGWCGYHSTSPPYLNVFPSLDMVINDGLKIKEIDSELLEKFRTVKTREEILAVLWCLDNYLPILYQDEYSLNVMVYEKLMKYGRKELVSLIDKIGEYNIPKSAFRTLKTPSRLTKERDVTIVSRVDTQLSKWKDSLSKDQIQRILTIVADFGLDFYTENIEPDYDNICINK